MNTEIFICRSTAGYFLCHWRRFGCKTNSSKNAHTSFTAKQFYNQFLWWQRNQAKSSRRPPFPSLFSTYHPWQIRSQEKLTNIKNDVNFLKMPTCLQINSPVAVQILGEARFEGETMRRESAKIREKQKKQTRERENENFNPRKTPNTQAFLSCAQLSWAELRPRFLPPSPEHRFISLNLPLFGHQLCNNAKGAGRGIRVPGKKYRKNKIKINLRMAHKISLASYFQIIFFLFCATSSVTWAAPVPPAPSRGLATQSSHHPLL